jgi:Txe/YoeB family toxin of Txe-Axe toxin-antitoxin module
MADMVPDKLPRRASKGEVRTFEFLQKLPDDYIAYYEPLISNRRPDFILIGPDIGVLVIEVKGWYIGDILQANDAEVTIDDEVPRIESHPLAQAREYMWKLSRECQHNPLFNQLINSEGKYKGKFIFPFGHMVILSNISHDQLKKNPHGDLSQVFRDVNTITRDKLIQLENATSEEIKHEIINHFDPFWKFKPLNPDQINIIRAVIHPEIRVNPLVNQVHKEIIDFNKENQNLKILDLRQERYAQKIGDGHRIIYGVAGSGKTIILMRKAKILHEEETEFKILVLCYNVMLSEVFKREFPKEEYPRIDVYHFDGWAKKNGVKRYFDEPVETDEELGERFYSILKSKSGDYRTYDAILIDEGQDFPHIWFSCVLSALKDPNEGDLLIVLDENQSIKQKRSYSWKNIGINVQGGNRSSHVKLGLDKNYRNTRQILELAHNFAILNENKSSDEFKVIPSCARREGFKPLLVHCSDHLDEAHRVVQYVKKLVSTEKYCDTQPYGLRPDEIGILYPRSNQDDKKIIRWIMNSIKEFAPCLWLSENAEARTKIKDPGVKIQTVASSKGLQYRIVILLFSGSLPMSSYDPVIIEKDKKLMYVALTRPEDFLIVLYSTPSPFIEIMRNSHSVLLVNE